MKAVKYGIAGFIIIGFMFRLITLQHADFLPPSHVKQEDARLFYQLIQSEVLETVKDTNQLKLPRKDYELIEKARRAQYPALPDLSQDERKRCELIHALYYSAPGRFVLNQIQQWNQTRQLAGIRDNRTQKDGDFKNKWQIMNTSGTFQTIPFLSEQFGYVNHGELRPDFSNWLVVHPFQQDDQLRFESHVHVNRAHNVIVQLIGSYPVHIGPARNVSSIKPICDSRVSKKNKCTQKTALAFEIHFSFKKGSHHIIIESSGIQNPHTCEPGRHIQMDAKTLAFHWSSVNRRSFVKLDAPFMIRTADGVPLTDSRGNPTDFTLKNGLVPLIGIGKKTPFSLYGLLARSQIPFKTNEITLSINSRIQAIAQKTLNHHVNQMCRRDKKYRKKQFCKQRKASVVILNAKTGAILAAANHPLPPKNIHPWDLQTFDRFYSKNNPMTLQAWQGIGVHSAPGSSFKPVVVMAALDMQSYKNVNHMVQELSHISPIYDKAQSIKDFYQSYMSKKSETYWEENIFPCFTKPKNDQLTLTDAIMRSKNGWHRRLAILMDGEKAFSYDSDCLPNTSQSFDLPDFNLCRIAKRLGFDSFIDLAPHLDQTIRLRPDRLKHIAGDILFAHAGELALCKKGSNKMKELAKTAIGHGVSATPLQMARVAASIATQKIVMPDLFSQYNHGLLASAPRHQALYLDGLDILQKAMGKVVQYGKVKEEFSDYEGHQRVYGKTGTASMFENEEKDRKDEYNTSWFVGWQAPEHDTNPPLAFACMMTHALHPGYRKGAEVSAPVIKDILKQIEMNVVE